MGFAEGHCPPPLGLTPARLLVLLGLTGRGEGLRRRLARALHARAPALFPAEDDRAGFGARLIDLLGSAEGERLFAAAAAEAEADTAPAERRLDLDAAVRRAAQAALAEAAPPAAARLAAEHAPEIPALALAAACAEAALWAEAALLLWRLAAVPEEAEGAARLAADHPPLADALPALVDRPVPPTPGGTRRANLLRLMGFAEDPETAVLLPPPGAEVECRLAALPPERLADLPAGWRAVLHRASGERAERIIAALGAFEQATLTLEAREGSLREAALRQELDLVAVEAALQAAREAEAACERAWRALVAAIAAAR